MTLPTDYTNATVLTDLHPAAHNDTNAAVNVLDAALDALDTRVTDVETDTTTIIDGNGIPGAGVGVVGDYYLDTTSGILYGPKNPDVTPPTESITVGGPGPTDPLVGEVGTRVQFLTAGTVSAIRYSKAPSSPTGIVLYVWADAGGAALTSESSSQASPGTYTQTLTTPVNVTAGTILRFSGRVGYHTTIQTVTNSLNCTFLDYRSAGATATFPTNANNVTGYVVPIFGSTPLPIWPVAVAGGITDHGTMDGLTDDDHTQYVALAGRAGGQTFVGGTANADDLVIKANGGTNAGDLQLAAGSNLATFNLTAGAVAQLTGFAGVAIAGATTITGNTTVTGNGTVSGTLGVTGALTAGSFDQTAMRGAVTCVAWNNNSSLTVTTAGSLLTIWNGTLYTVPAGSLFAGDTIDILATTSILQNSGGARDVEFSVFWGATNVVTLGTTGSLIAAAALTRQARLQATLQFATVGGAGTLYASAGLTIGDPNTAAGADAAYVGARSQTNPSMATNVGQTIDVRVKMSGTTHASFTTAGRGIRIDRHNAP